MKIVIVGVGALGSHLLLFARNLKAEFTVIDFDRVEQKNILSQFHTQMGRNRNKTQALQQSMQGLFGMKIKAVPHKLTHENVETLLAEANLVVDCLDNGESRRLIQAFVREKSIPCVHGALAANGEFASVIWDEHFQIDDEPSTGEATCEDGQHLPFIAMASSLLASKIQRFLADGQKESLHIHPNGVIPLTSE